MPVFSIFSFNSRRPAFAALTALALALTPLAPANGVQAAQDASQAASGGRYHSTVSAKFKKPAQVALDVECQDKTSLAMKEEILKILAAKGVQLAPEAPTVLRFTVEPCHVGFFKRDNPGLREAYRGTSSAKENSEVQHQFTLNFGDKSAPPDKLSVSFMLYAPGATPTWSAQALAPRQDPARYQEQLRAMVARLLEAFGEARDGALGGS